MGPVIAERTFSEAIDKLKRTLPSDRASVEEFLQGILASGSALIADPVTDPSGNPYIKLAAVRLSCR